MEHGKPFELAQLLTEFGLAIGLDDENYWESVVMHIETITNISKRMKGLNQLFIKWSEHILKLLALWQGEDIKALVESESKINAVVNELEKFLSTELEAATSAHGVL